MTRKEHAHMLLRREERSALTMLLFESLFSRRLAWAASFYFYMHMLYLDVRGPHWDSATTYELRLPSP